MIYNGDPAADAKRVAWGEWEWRRENPRSIRCGCGTEVSAIGLIPDVASYLLTHEDSKHHRVEAVTDSGDRYQMGESVL